MCTPRLMALKPICFARPRESPFSTSSQSAGNRISYLRQTTRPGDLSCPVPEFAAKLFLGAIVADYQLLGLLAPGLESFEAGNMRAHVKEAVELFLASYGPSM
jgi:AefR-like transcriptional repressor, C-terminal domain